MQLSMVMKGLIPTLNHVKAPQVSLKHFKCTKDNFQDFFNKLKYIHYTKDHSWAEDSDTDDSDDTETEIVSNIDSENKASTREHVDYKFDYKLHEMELRRVLLYRIGKYELEEGEELHVNGKLYYD